MASSSEMKPVKVQFLSKEKREKIYKGALKILEKTGVKVGDKVIRGLLKKRGAKVDDTSEIVKLPKEIVEESLVTTNKKPILNCINGKELHLYGENRYYGSLVIDPYVIDYKDGPRKPRLSDIERHTRLGDILPKVDNIYKMDHTCTDVPEEDTDLITLKAFVSNTTTSYNCAPATMESARAWVEVSEIMAGASLKDNPILVAYIPIVTPLVFTKKDGEILRYLLAKGALLRSGPCPIAGATSPYTLAGTITLSEAEMLFSVVVAQSILPGASCLLCSGASTLDMSSGIDVYCGLPKDIMHIAVLEMVEYHGLPSSVGLFSTVVSKFDFQAGQENTFGLAYSFFLKNNLLGGIGSIANAAGISSEKIVIDYDLIEMLERIEKGIDLSNDKLAIESIMKVGPGGNYLTDDLTLKYLRSDEHFSGNLYVRPTSNKETQTMLKRAHERVEELIQHHKPKVPEDRLEEVEKYISKHHGK